MVNTNMVQHPKYYKELRKRNRELRASAALPSVPQSDQAISNPRATAGDGSVRPDPGLKLQAASSKPQATETQAASDKPQAPSDKHQASSRKQQAAR